MLVFLCRKQQLVHFCLLSCNTGITAISWRNSGFSPTHSCAWFQFRLPMQLVRTGFLCCLWDQVSPSCDNKTSSLSSCSVVVGFHRNLLPIIYERICFSRLSRHNMFFMASCLHPLLHANLSHSQKSHSGSNYSTRPPQWDIAALLLVRYKITVSSALWVFAAMMISYLPYISIFNLILPVLLSVLH